MFRPSRDAEYSLSHVRNRKTHVDDDERYDDCVRNVEQIDLVDSLLVEAKEEDGVEDRAKAKQEELNKVRSEKLIGIDGGEAGRLSG